MKQSKLYMIPLMMLLQLWTLFSCENESPVEPAGTEDVNGITLKLSIPRPTVSRALEESGKMR